MQVDIAAELSDEIQKNKAAQDSAEIEAEVARQRAVTFKSSMHVASGFEPTKWAKAMQVHRESGIAPRTAYDNWDQIEKVKQASKLDGLFNAAPRTAEALSDPSNAILAKGDEDNLRRMEEAISDSKFDEQGFFEKTLGKWWLRDTVVANRPRQQDLARIEETFNAIDAGEHGGEGFAFLYREADAAGRAQMRADLLLQRNLGFDEARVAASELEAMPQDPVERQLQEAEQRGEGVGGAASVIADNPSYLGRAAATSLPDSIPSIALAMVPYVGPALAAGNEARTAANYKFEEILQEQGIDSTDPIQMMQAIRNDDLMREVGARAERYGAGIGVVSLASFGIMNKVLAPRSIGGTALSRSQREWINAGMQVPAQGSLEALGEFTGQIAERGQYSDVKGGEVLIEGLVGGLMAGPEAGVFAGKRFTNHMIQARRAERAAGLQSDLVSRSLESSTRKNDPASFDAIVGQQLAGKPNEFIEIPAAKLQELNQSGMVNIPELLENVGIDPNHYTAQVDLGGTIRMKNSSYLAYLSEHDALLASSIRVASNDYSLDDVQELDRQMVADMEKIAAQFGETDQMASAYSDVMGQLISSGYERGAADTTAKQYAAVMTRLAQQTGQTVEEVMAANPLNIAREVPQQVRRIKGDDLTLMLGRLRAGDIPRPADMFGKTLREYIVAAGGLDDTGGELATFDADSGRVGSNRLARPGGRSPDDAAMDAWENGYFPGVAVEDVTPDLLISALRDEAAGTPRYSVNQENATLRDQADSLEALQEFLDREGVDLATATDEEIRILLSGERPAAQTLEQSGDTELSRALAMTVDDDMADLAAFYAKDEDYQFERFQEREDVFDRFVARAMADDEFAGMQQPTSYGSVMITPSAKEAGMWQVTQFSKDGTPNSDSGIQTKEQALRDFIEEARPAQRQTLNQSQPANAAFTAPQEAETGKPMRVYFARNTVSSKGNAPAGMDFGQKIEPAGEYMVIQDSDMSGQGGDGWSYGVVEFKNPLVLEHKSTDSTGWKKDLSEMFGGKTGKALANAVKKAGHDGIVTRDRYGYSETVNLSGVKGAAQDAEPSDGKNLIAIHNLSAENLAFADSMGGIAVPSIGVVTTDAGGVDGFGDITLIGTKDLGDPRQEPVFSADAYTVRFPRPEFKKAKSKDADAILKPLKPIADEFGDVRVTENSFDSMVNQGDGSRAIDDWMSSPAVMAMFLREKGRDIKPVMRDATLESPFAPAEILNIEPLIRSANKYATLNENDHADVVEAERLLGEAIDKKHAKRPALAAKMKERMMAEPGFAAFTLMGDLRIAKRGSAVDPWETRTAVRKMIEDGGLELEFKQWVEGKILPVMGDPLLTVGRRKVPYTLDNIVEVMTKGPVRGQEKTMTFSAGQARAASSMEFSDIEQMRKQAAESIVDPAQYEEAKKTTEKLLDQYRDAAIRFTTITNWQGRPDTFEALDSSMRAIAKFSTKKKRDRAAMEAALKSEKFDVAAMKAGAKNPIDQSLVQSIEAEIQKWAGRLEKMQPGDSRIPEIERRLKMNQDALQEQLAKAADQSSSDPIGLAMLAAEALLNAPVPYFEAKPQRAVGLSEFAGAVVPKNLPASARAILEKNGIEIIEYEGDRMQAVREAADKLHSERGDIRYQSGDDNARGSITFGPRRDGVRRFDIRLGKKSDLSTVLHEMGHYYLEVIGDLVSDGKANEALAADYGVILDWLGAEPGTMLTVDQHEQFARGFEKYLAEGKAPSIELQGAFSRFKRWLTAIYRDLRALDVELSPEVRGVFDRLLASEDAITEAREALALSEQYESSITALMTPEELANYTRASLQARDEATTEIEQEILRAEMRKETEWYREQKRKVEREVRDELENSQPYQARKWLFGNAPYPSLGKPLRLDSAAVTELFGSKSKEARFLGRARVREGGVHPEIAASMLGYANPAEMLHDMRSVPGLAEAIKTETERRMAERFPDPRVDGTLTEKSMAAVGEREAEVQAIQLRALAREAGRKASQHRIIKEAARQHIARLKLRDVIPYSFQRASTKAAKSVEAALLDGNMPKAYEEKEKQLMNLHLYREAVKAQDLAQKKRDQAKTYMKAGAKRKRLQSASVENYELAYPDGRVEYAATKAAANQAEADGAVVTPLFNFLEQVDGLLTKYEFGTPRRAIRQQREALATFLASMANESIVVNPPEWLLLDRAERRNWKDLTIDELVDVVDMIRQIEQMAKNKLNVLKGDAWAEFEPLRDAIVATVNLNASKARNSAFNKSFADEIRRWGREWLGTLPADQIARELDGQDELGPVQENITTPIQVAGRNALIREKAEHQGLADLIKQFYTPEQLKGMNDPSKLIAIPEIGDSLTRMQMVMLMANLGNEGNRQALLSEARGIWTAETIQAVMARLDSNDADFVEGLWAWIDKFWPEVSENEARRTGVVPAKVQGTPYPVKLADGKIRVLKGGYFPLKYDGDLSIKTSQDEVANAFKNMTAGRTAKAYTPEGHKIERVGSGGRPVKLSFGVVTGHLNEVVRDIVMTDPVNQAWRFLHDREVQSAFERSNLKELFTALEIWMQDTAEGEVVDASYTTAAARWLRTGFTANVMLFNLGNSLLNLAGTHPLVVLGKRWAMRGYRDALSPANWNQMYELSSFMREARIDSFNKDLTLVQDQMNGKGGWRSAMTTAGFYLHNKLQMFMDAVAWMGAYQKGMSMDLVGADLVTYADQRVVEASGSGVFADRSSLERGTLSRQTRQNELVRGLTTLAGYMVRKMAIARRRTAETNFKDLGEALNWSVDMALLFTIEGLMFALVKGNVPDDEDEDQAVEWTKTAAWETVASIGAGTPPFGRPLVAGVQGFGGGSSSIDIFAEQFGNAVAQAKQGDADVTALKSVVALVGTATRTPGIATNRVIDWLDRANEGDVPPWYELFTGNRNK